MAPRVESYRFGCVRIDGREYQADLIILPSGVVPGWWRREGHNLTPEDLKDAAAARPAVLVVGTGASGLMKVPPATVSYLEDAGIKVEAFPTGRAVERYNELAAGGCPVAAAFHLTC